MACNGIDIISSTDPFEDGSLVVKYIFDDNAAPLVGDGWFDGSYKQYGRSISVSGADLGYMYSGVGGGEISTADNNGLPPNNAARTISIFFNPALLHQTENPTAFELGDTASVTGGRFAFAYNDSTDSWMISVGGSNIQFPKTKNEDDALHHFLITQSSNTIQSCTLYMDNVHIPDNGSTGSMISASTNLIHIFGRGGSGGVNNTQISMFEVYDRVLNDEERQALYYECIENATAIKVNVPSGWKDAIVKVAEGGVWKDATSKVSNDGTWKGI